MGVLVFGRGQLTDAAAEWAEAGTNARSLQGASGGQSTTERFPIAFELDKYRNGYRYFYKYFGRKGVRRCRHATLVWLWIRKVGCGLVQLVKPSEGLKVRIELYRAAAEWNKRVDPVQLVENGKEPQIDLKVPVQIPQ
jgi:hypothetical protein